MIINFIFGILTLCGATSSAEKSPKEVAVNKLERISPASDQFRKNTSTNFYMRTKDGFESPKDVYNEYRASPTLMQGAKLDSVFYYIVTHCTDGERVIKAMDTSETYLKLYEDLKREEEERKAVELKLSSMKIENKEQTPGIKS